MTTHGRRRFLAVLAAAVGAGGLWWVREGTSAPGPTSADGRALLDRGSGSGTAASLSPSTLSNPSTTGSTEVASDSTTTDPPATTSTTQTTTTTEAARPPVTLVEVIPRAAWGSLPVAGEFARHSVSRITVHHSAVLFTENRLGPARIRQHQRHHQSLGWPDLAYHVVIDRAGNVFEGRPFDAVGDTGTNYDPTGHFLPMCEGNFDEQDPSAAQIEALTAVVAWATTEYRTDVVAPHREYAATACPGDQLAALVGDLARRAAEAGGVELRMLSLDEGMERVAAIEA